MSKGFCSPVEDRYMPYIGDLPHTFNKTGNWRFIHPLREEKTAPCQFNCPLKNDIPHWLNKIREGDWAGAWEELGQYNPFPAITGRVCYHNCQAGCNRQNLDEPVAIRLIEKMIGEWKLQNIPALAAPPSAENGHRVAVVGSGPAGLSCAYYLRQKGYQVTVYESMPVAGGMLALGIPAHRLPRDILAGEVKFLESMGVGIRTGVRIGESINLDNLWQEHGAVFAATGAGPGMPLNIPGAGMQGVYDSLAFLREANLGRAPGVGDRVAVIGGGNTAMDAAITARHMGARQVVVVYRRSEKEMPAHAEEIAAARAAGVEFIFQAAPVSVSGEERARCLRLVKTVSSGRDKPVYTVEDSQFDLPVDTILAAIGQKAKPGFLPPSLLNSRGVVAAEEGNGMTAVRGIFAGGDAVTGPATVSGAIYWGRQAAGAIDLYLSGREREEIRQALNKQYRMVAYQELNTYYFPKSPARFNENSVSREAAVEEAGRCFSCGTCNSCGACWIFCPDIAIKETGQGYKIDYDYCKGCGICSRECPRAVISMAEGRAGDVNG